MCWRCRASPGLGLDAPARASHQSADALQDTVPRFHLTPGGHAGADGLLSSFAWSGGDPVRFGFTRSATDYEVFHDRSEPARGVARTGGAMQDAIRFSMLSAARPPMEHDRRRLEQSKA
jgi:hypothetical protein